jgi:hypothetical protein
MHCVLLLTQGIFTFCYSYALIKAEQLSQKYDYWLGMEHFTESMVILFGAILDLIVCALVCRIVHDCQTLELPKRGLVDSSASDTDNQIDADAGPESFVHYS